MSSLMQQSVRGIKWSAATQLVAQVAQYGSFVLLARLLSPTDFGYMATATLAVGFVAMLNELGLGAALIQRQDLRPGHLNACFWINLATGLVLCALVAAASGPFASFFHAPAAAPLLAWLAASFPLVAFVVVPKALMERALRFKELGLVDASCAVINAIVSVGLALAHAGAWALVAGTLAGYVAQVVLMWPLAGWRPGLAFTREELRELFRFGLNVLGTRLVGYANNNVDYMVVGHVLGPAALGAYSLAYKLVSWPMIKISHVTLRVMYPAFARLQDDDEALRRHYRTLLGTLAMIVFPLLAALLVLAPAVVPWIFGAAWHSAVLPTQILCGMGALKATICSIGSIFLGKGRPDLELMTNVVGIGLVTSLVCVGVHWGIAGVAAAMLVSTMVGGPWQQSVANRLIGLPMRDYWAALRVPAIAALLGAGAVAFAVWLAGDLPPVVLLLLAAPVMGGVYLAALSAQGLDWLGMLQAFRQKQPDKPGVQVPLGPRRGFRLRRPAS